MKQQDSKPYVLHDWSQCLPYLRLLATTGFNQKLRAKVDESDIVQETLLQAHKARASFRGTTKGEFMAWLKQILTRNLMHATRDLTALKRDVSREVSLQSAVERSWFNTNQNAVGNGWSPGLQIEKNEDRHRLCAAIAHLPDGQRLAIKLHYFLEWPISQVADEMERTPVAVGGLLKRGLKTLRAQLGNLAD